MLKLEIAGQIIPYKNSEDLNDRIRQALDGIRGRRLRLDQECRLLRLQEKILERSLGGPKSPMSLREGAHAQ